MREFENAIECMKRGDLRTAEKILLQITAREPQDFDANHMLGIVCSELHKYEQAEKFFKTSLSIDPSFPPVYQNYGLFLSKTKLFDKAIEQFNVALRLFPSFAPVYSDRGNALQKLHKLDEAIADYNQAITLAPQTFGFYNNRGNAFLKKKQFSAALSDYERAIELNPNFADAHCGRGNVFTELKRSDDAFAAYDEALLLKPDLENAWLGRGNVFCNVKRYEEALDAYEKALSLEPHLAEAWCGRGNVFWRLKRYDEALDAYDRAQSHEPHSAEAWCGRGNVFTELKRYDDAFGAYDKALSLKPDLENAWLGRGNAFWNLKRYEEALDAYDKALSLEPHLAEAWCGRGNVFTCLKRFDEAFAAFDQALNLKPDLEYAEAARLSAKMGLCDWTKIKAEISHFLSAVTNQKLVSAPFTLFALPTSSADQLQAAKTFVAAQVAFPSLWRGDMYSHDRIRVAYFSADFRRHPVAHLAVGLFEQHDKSRFEITAISFGPDDGSDLRSSIKSAVENFVDVRRMPDDAVAELIHNREIDVIVDLMGLTEDSRFSVLSRRVAPIQVNFLGYPGTTGADFMDYIIADPTIIPKEHFSFYSEQVVWLPDTYLPTAYRSNESKHHISHDERYSSQRAPTRAECNLPEAAFVFCCFNGSYKINPVIFDVWMRLLRAVPDSVLWLSEFEPDCGS